MATGFWISQTLSLTVLSMVTILISVVMISEPLVRIKIEPVRASYEYIILLAVALGYGYGYRIMKRINSLGIENLRLTPSTVYPILRRLESNGLIEAVISEKGGRAIKSYKIAEKGLEYLLRTSITSLDIIYNMLKIHRDLLGEGDSASNKGFIEVFRGELEILRRRLRDLHEITGSILSLVEKLLEAGHQ